MCLFALNTLPIFSLPPLLPPPPPSAGKYLLSVGRRDRAVLAWRVARGHFARGAAADAEAPEPAAGGPGNYAQVGQQPSPRSACGISRA